MPGARHAGVEGVGLAEWWTLHQLHLVAEWGEPARIDMTHSVTKSLLSSVVGVAHDAGMIRSIDDTAREYVAPIQLYNLASDIGETRNVQAEHPDIVIQEIVGRHLYTYVPSPELVPDP